MSAAHLGRSRIVLTLVRAAAAIDARNIAGVTALMAAAQQGHVREQRRLQCPQCQRKARVHAPCGRSCNASACSATHTVRAGASLLLSVPSERVSSSLMRDLASLRS